MRVVRAAVAGVTKRLLAAMEKVIRETLVCRQQVNQQVNSTRVTSSTVSRHTSVNLFIKIFLYSPCLSLTSQIVRMSFARFLSTTDTKAANVNEIKTAQISQLR